MRGFDYAALYPDNIGAMVLDGLVDHSLDITALTTSQVASFSLTMRRMLEWMSSNSSSALQGRDVVEIWRELIQRADDTPIPAPECVQSGLCFPKVTSGDLRTAIYKAVTHPTSQWPVWSQYIKQAYDDGNATAFSYPYQGDTGIGYSQLSIICHDWHFIDNWQDFALLDYMSSTYSLDPRGPVGGQLWNIGCPKWPVQVTNPPTGTRVENSKNSLPILLMHSLLDAAVGYDQAIGVHQRIDSSVLLTRYDEGHGSLESVEAVDSMNAYFINGTVPEPLTIIGETMSQDVVTDFEILGWDQNVQ